jgi:enoyl-CoA hydratase/carnithine racemase
MKMSEKIIFDVHGDLGRITLNNPEKLNCLGFEMLEALDHSMQEVAARKELRVLLISGAGDRAFSTGADLKEFSSLTKDQVERWIRYGNKVFNALESLVIPTVALINGYALGGGLELALCCDFRLGTESTIIALPELQHGWLPGWGGMTRLRRLIGEARAKEVVMLNQKIPADEALRMGLLTRILKSGAEDKDLEVILKHLAGLKPAVFGLAKRALMDESRTTRGSDIDFDVLAMQAKTAH